MTRKAEFDALRYRTAVVTRARQIARKSVKEDLRACGKRPENYTCAALTRLAKARVGLHLKQAAEEITQWLILERR
jgi:hypothetical protein